MRVDEHAKISQLFPMTTQGITVIRVYLSAARVFLEQEAIAIKQVATAQQLLLYGYRSVDNTRKSGLSPASI